MSAFTTIKVEFGTQLRRLAFDSAASSWAAVRAQILTSYGIAAFESDECTLHYLDDENDLISVNSDSEFAEAVRCAKQKNKILKFILSKSEKASAKAATSAAASAEKQSQQEVDLEQKAPLLKLAVDARSDSDIRVEDAADGDAEQQVEEMDLPLDRRDLLSRSPTLSEASDSSFVSINAQSLRDELEEKDEKDEQAAEGGNDSSVLKAAAAAMDEDAKAAIASSAAVTPSQPEFVASDRAVVQDVMKQLAQDIIQLKPETPTAMSSVSVASTAAVEAKSRVDANAEVAAPSPKQESKADVDSASSSAAAGMKVKELRSVVEGVINEKFLGWLDDLLAAVDNLDHADEDLKRVQQLTARIRLGLADVSANRQYVQRMSDGMAKKMMRVMKQAEGKQANSKKEKDKEDKHKDKPQPKEDEEETKKASPPSPPPAPTTAAAGTSSCSASTPCAVVVHDSVTCDGCNMSPIRGVRFHCISCDQIEKVRRAGGYDLCEGCESKGVHQQVDGKRHIMIKIKTPTKVIVDIEAPHGPITGPAVYDVLRVNADGSRTPFRTPQPVVALPVPTTIVTSSTSASMPSPSSSSSSSKAEKQEVGGPAKVEELERRIRALESLITVDAKKKAEKRAEKDCIRKEKAERKRAKQEATALAKAAKLEAKSKQKEAKAAAKAEAEAAKKKVEEEGAEKKKNQDEKAEGVPKVEELKSVQVESVPQQDAKKDAVQLTSPVNAESASHTALIAPTTATAAALPPATAAVMPVAAGRSSSESSAAAAAASVSSAPTASPVPFSFANFPFSNMVNSITSTMSNTLAATPFAFGGTQSNNNRPTAVPAPAIQPLASAPLFSAVAANSAAASASASSGSNASAVSIWSSPTVSGKRTLADVRAPAFFPYIAQLRELEKMGFDVDKSIYALRYYRGDMQKSINSML